MTTKNYDIEFVMRSTINKECRAFVQHGGKIKTLAGNAGVSPQTVSNLVSNETKYPRGHTLIAVLSELGYSIRLEKNAGVSVPTNVVPLAETRGKSRRKSPLPSKGGRHTKSLAAS